MRHFKEIWFAGNGEQSTKRAKLLRDLLDKALEKLSGIQQPLSATASEEVWDAFEEQMESIQAEIEEIARDIYCALTGDEVPE